MFSSFSLGTKYLNVIFSDLNSGKGLDGVMKPTSNQGGNPVLAEGRGELILHGRSKLKYLLPIRIMWLLLKIEIITINLE